MKKVLFLAFFAVSTASAFGQFAFEDALKLAPKMTFNENDSVWSPSSKKMEDEDWQRLFSHVWTEKTVVDQATFLAANGSGDAQNPFVFVATMRNRGVFSTISAVTPAGPSLGTVADGLAKFLVKRTKEELTLAFFDQMKRELNREGSSLGYFFPETRGLLSLIDEQVWQFSAFLNTLREAYSRDFRAMPGHLAMALREPDLRLFDQNLAKNDTVRALSVDVSELLQLALEERSPIATLDYLASPRAELQRFFAKKGSANWQDAAAIFRTAELFEKALRRSDEGSRGFSRWHSARELRDSLRDEKTRDVFLGLLWLRAEGIAFSDGTTLRGILAKAKNGLEFWNSLLREIEKTADAGERFSAAERGLGQNLTESGVFESRFEDYSAAFEQILESGERVRMGFSKSKKQSSNRYLRLYRNGKDLVFDVRRGRYTSAVADFFALVSDVFEGKSPMRREFLRYANFMATVSEAENSDQVAAAIEAFALPAGSSRLKKSATSSISLNAYAGLGVRPDLLFEKNEAEKSLRTPAAVGFAFNRGLKKRGSLSLFVPILDVGGLFAYRFREPLGEIESKIEWANIVAPGAYAVYGFGRNLPLALGVGGQMSPTLRDVDRGGQLVLDKTPAFRPNVFLTVDIPVLHFSMKN